MTAAKAADVGVEIGGEAEEILMLSLVFKSSSLFFTLNSAVGGLLRGLLISSAFSVSFLLEEVVLSSLDGLSKKYCCCSSGFNGVTFDSPVLSYSSKFNMVDGGLLKL